PAPRRASGRLRARSRHPPRTRSRGPRTPARSGTAMPPRSAPARTVRRGRRAAAPARTPRSAPLAPRARRALRARRRGSPPDGSLHRALDVIRVPEARGEVLPAAIREDRHDHALVELARQLARDMADGAGRDAGKVSFLVEQAAHL